MKLICPKDHKPLSQHNSTLSCINNHSYNIKNGIPVILLKDIEQTHWVAEASLKCNEDDDSLFLETLGINKDEILMIKNLPDTYVDKVINVIMPANCGLLYKNLIGKMASYPIPDLRLPDGEGKSFLEIGCGWGRWCIAAAQKNYNVIGIDPSLGAVSAAKRATKQLGIGAEFICTDGRYLPFESKSFDVIFSYSVIKHFSKENTKLVIKEISRILKPSGISLIQMPNMFGLRSIYHQIKRGFKNVGGFDVRYWRPIELLNAFSFIGKSYLTVDGFFGLGMQYNNLLPNKYKLIICLSEILRKINGKIKIITYLADSLYIKSFKSKII